MMEILAEPPRFKIKDMVTKVELYQRKVGFLTLAYQKYTNK